MASRIRQELLDSDIDIRTSESSESGDGRFTVTMKQGGVRMVLGAFFLVPGVLLLWNAVTAWSLFSLVFALLFCPFLFGLFFLFGFGTAEKSFDRERRVFVRSFRLFGFVMTESAPLPEQGTVLLDSKLSAGGGKTPGGSMRYSIVIPGCSGAGFSAYHDYRLAADFAQRLAGFLSYQLEDIVDPRYRKDMRDPS